MSELTNRQRFHAIMNFESFDRLPVVEWAPWWNQTTDRWRGEGLPADLEWRYDIAEHFTLDQYRYVPFHPLGPDSPKPAAHGSGIITCEADYEKILPTLYDPRCFDLERWKKWAELQAAGDSVIWYNMDGFFWFPRVLLGIERHLYAFYDQPELMQRINSDLVEWQLKLFDAICEVLTPDFVCFAEDMSYNNGPMLSEDLFNEFMKPCYQRIVPRLRERGCFVFIDSDGDITSAAPWFLDSGIQGILPLEKQSGLEVARLRETHPHIRLIGAFDKMVMNRGEAAMRAEFERLLPVAAQGGLIISCDHQTPPGVSYEDYQLYLRLFREYAQRAGELSRSRAQSAPA
jgi:Uroporphyrinogen decarboxylase (URO-D)